MQHFLPWDLDFWISGTQPGLRFQRCEYFFKIGRLVFFSGVKSIENQVLQIARQLARQIDRFTFMNIYIYMNIQLFASNMNSVLEYILHIYLYEYINMLANIQIIQFSMLLAVDGSLPSGFPRHLRHCTIPTQSREKWHAPPSGEQNPANPAIQEAKMPGMRTCINFHIVQLIYIYIIYIVYKIHSMYIYIYIHCLLLIYIHYIFVRVVASGSGQCGDTDISYSHATCTPTQQGETCQPS